MNNKTDNNSPVEYSENPKSEDYITVETNLEQDESDRPTLSSTADTPPAPLGKK
ncbi:hypothetical protein [Citrobacter braakii]|uniref:hypothetical protein n=1 Tax=Citrobacter braakii TaxID=57706 RepID=UPI001301F9EB|nr:hypothetical protein [Citrobacter braakii]EKN5801607.1 hypothetical protein [Salmonella enterica subsp. enterica]QXC18169.1 hypothetical protein I6L51_08945 [Citrobacter braakii]